VELNLPSSRHRSCNWSISLNRPIFGGWDGQRIPIISSTTNKLCCPLDEHSLFAVCCLSNLRNCASKIALRGQWSFLCWGFGTLPSSVLDCLCQFQVWGTAASYYPCMKITACLPILRSWVCGSASNFSPILSLSWLFASFWGFASYAPFWWEEFDPKYFWWEPWLRRHIWK